MGPLDSFTPFIIDQNQNIITHFQTDIRLGLFYSKHIVVYHQIKMVVKKGLNLGMHTHTHTRVFVG